MSRKAGWEGKIGTPRKNEDKNGIAYQRANAEIAQPKKAPTTP